MSQYIPDLGEYYLIVLDKNGVEQTESGSIPTSQRLKNVLTEASPPYTDVFLFSHGWNSDVEDAKRTYRHWIVTMAMAQRDREAASRFIPGFKPLIIGIHWPSLAWADEKISAATPGLLLGKDVPFNLSPEDPEVPTWASQIADTPAGRDAIRTILESARMGEDAEKPSSDVQQAYPILPPRVLQAYEILFRESKLKTGDTSDRPGAEQFGFDPQAIVIGAQKAPPAATAAPELLSIFGDLVSRGRDIFIRGRDKLSDLVDRRRDIVLSPLRQLSFWIMKDRARIVGETGGNKLLRMLQMSGTNKLRFHLMGHSFGCIVVSAAVAGVETPGGPAQPIDSLFLVQGAMSLWSYANHVPVAGGKPGYFYRIIRDNLVRGAILTTHSDADTALGFWYPLGAGIMGQDLLAGPRLPRFGATGSFGIQGLSRAIDMPMVSVESRYPFARGRVYNLDATQVIRIGSGLGGAHNDIAHTEVAHAFWAMVMVDRAGHEATRVPPADLLKASRPRESKAEVLSSTLAFKPPPTSAYPALLSAAASTTAAPSYFGAPLRGAEWSAAPLPPTAQKPSVAKSRWINAELEDHDRAKPLEVKRWYSLTFDVDVRQRESATDTAPFDDAKHFPEGTEVINLTVRLNTEDFELDAETRILQVERTRTSRKARFQISPLHDAWSTLTATFFKDNNFIQEMEMTFDVGTVASSPVKVVRRGREPSSLGEMKPRDVHLMIKRDPSGGYECYMSAGNFRQAKLRVTPEQLTKAVDVARDQMMKVMMRFPTDLKIAEDDQHFALETLAQAGAELFDTLFLFSPASADSKFIGNFLKETLGMSKTPLKLQVVADFAPIPWAWLYVGDVRKEPLSWDKFIGMRHIVEQIPLDVGNSVERLLELSTSTIPSNKPRLQVSVNINTKLNPTASDQARWWSEIQSGGKSVHVTHRTTCNEVIQALADDDTADQILYFYCHANPAGAGDPMGPPASSLVLSDAAITLRQLELSASTETQLAGNPLVFINACESEDKGIGDSSTVSTQEREDGNGRMSPSFYAGFVPYFMGKGARGVVGTECPTPAHFGSEWAKDFFRCLLEGTALGDALLKQRVAFLQKYGNPLGLLYAVHCDADTRIKPAVY